MKLLIVNLVIGEKMSVKTNSKLTFTVNNTDLEKIVNVNASSVPVRACGAYRDAKH